MPNKSALNFLGKTHSGIDPNKATGLKLNNNYSPQKNNINQDYETVNEKHNQQQEEFENHQNNENNINSDNIEKEKINFKIEKNEKKGGEVFPQSKEKKKIFSF